MITTLIEYITIVLLERRFKRGILYITIVLLERRFKRGYLIHNNSSVREEV
jgi:hypothetical protein